MDSYQISPDRNIEWSLLVDECSGLAGGHGKGSANVLSLVMLEFENIFGRDLINSHSTLAVAKTDDDPITWRSHNLIFLSLNGGFYLQHIYQFSHELCHFMVPSDVCKSYRWLEETLCQVMSWFILQRIYDKRDATPCYELAGLYAKMQDYITDSKNDFLCLQDVSLSNFLQKNLQHLEEDCYDRPMNRAIAYHIFPIIWEYPELWSIVPYLDKTNGDMSLLESLLLLKDLSKVSSDGFELLIQRLCD